MAQQPKPVVDRSKAAALNLSVLQRIDAHTEEVLCSAGHVALYDFDTEQRAWARKDVEGSLFVVKRRVQPRFQVFILNKKSHDNFVENIGDGFQFELSKPYILYRNSDDEVVGIWFYDSEECDRVATLLNKIIATFPSTRARQEQAAAQAANGGTQDGNAGGDDDFFGWKKTNGSAPPPPAGAPLPPPGLEQHHLAQDSLSAKLLGAAVSASTSSAAGTAAPPLLASASSRGPMRLSDLPGEGGQPAPPMLLNPLLITGAGQQAPPATPPVAQAPQPDEGNILHRLMSASLSGFQQPPQQQPQQHVSAPTVPQPTPPERTAPAAVLPPLAASGQQQQGLGQQEVQARVREMLQRLAQNDQFVSLVASELQRSSLA